MASGAIAAPFDPTITPPSLSVTSISPRANRTPSTRSEPACASAIDSHANEAASVATMGVLLLRVRTLFRSGVDEDVEPAVAHALHVEGHLLALHHVEEARVPHDLLVDGVPV